MSNGSGEKITTASSFGFCQNRHVAVVSCAVSATCSCVVADRWVVGRESERNTHLERVTSSGVQASVDAFQKEVNDTEVYLSSHVSISGGSC